jgi:nitric oxide reductase large subunit
MKDMTMTYLTISLVIVMIAIAACAYTLGARAVGSTIEDSLSGYAGSRINISIIKAAVFFFTAFLALVISIRLAVSM